VFLDLTGYRSRYKDFISDVLPVGDLRSGIVTLDENGNPRAGEQTLSLINFGKQTVLGVDVGVNVYATDRLLLKGNASFIKTDDLEDAQGLNVPFNTPEAILNIGLSTSDFVTRGTSLDLSLRHIVEHDFRSGPHAGTLPAYTVVDINVGYQTQVGVAYRVSAHNILNNRHREFVTGPEIGRIVVGEVAYGF
jgi:outer membrane receptor protein involved in Fe transport